MHSPLAAAQVAYDVRRK